MKWLLRLCLVCVSPVALLVASAATLPPGAARAAEGEAAPAAPPPVAAPAPGAAHQVPLLAGFHPPQAVPPRDRTPPITRVRSLRAPEDFLSRAQPDGRGGLRLPGPDGGRALTLDAPLQAALTRVLRDYRVPYGAAVVVEPASGRVLALAEHSEAMPGLRGLWARAVFPAASIFKIVTGAALLEAGVRADEQVCFHGGKRRLSERLLRDSARDRACLSLAEAMGQSANVAFAKLALRHLSADALRARAATLRFNREIPFPVPVDVSLAAIPEEPFALASTAAGFGDVYLSPLHGALLAAAAVTGRWSDPVLFEPAPGSPSPPGESVLSAEVASALTDTLEETVRSGTARQVFRQRGFRVEGAVGKTGTLADRNPFRDYSWFVGAAPRDNPRVAVGVVIVNEARWRIRAPWMGREALRLALERVGLRERAQAPAPGAGVAGGR